MYTTFQGAVAPTQSRGVDRLPVGLRELVGEPARAALRRTTPPAADAVRAPVSSVDRRGWACLMAAAQAGDRASYRRLLEDITPWLRRYYARRLPAALVDDVVQEALMTVHLKRATFDPDRPFGPWLSAIARYKWIDRLRLMKRADAEAADDLVVRDHGPAVLSAMILRDMLAQLRPAQAEAIRLVKLCGHSVDEAAGLTGQSPSLIKVNVHRGLARLVAMAQQDARDTLVAA